MRPLLILHTDRHEALGVRIWKRLEEHGVDDAEYRRVGSDPEGERRDGNEGEARGATQESQGVAHVLESILEPPLPHLVTRLLLDPLGTAERDDRRAPGLVRRHPLSDVLRRLHL